MKEKIESGKFEELRREVFGQKLNKDSEGTYTVPLSNDEECALMNLVLLGTPLSKDFVLEYIKHYPLCNKAIDVLLSQIDNPDSKHVLLKSIERYGFTENQGLTICHKIGLNDLPFMKKFCRCGRIFYMDLYQLLTLLDADEKLGEVYRKSVDAYRNSK